MRTGTKIVWLHFDRREKVVKDMRLVVEYRHKEFVFTSGTCNVNGGVSLSIEIPFDCPIEHCLELLSFRGVGEAPPRGGSIEKS